MRANDKNDTRRPGRFASGRRRPIHATCVAAGLLLVATCAGPTRAAPNPQLILDDVTVATASEIVLLAASTTVLPTAIGAVTSTPDCGGDLGVGAITRCNPGDGHDKCRTDADCEDGEYCHDFSGLCRPRPDPEQCRTDTDCGDGEVCNRWTRRCQPGEEACRDDADCDDGLFCNGAEVCTVDRYCAGGSRPCVDGVACTIDACDEETDACEYIPSTACCDDGLFCNGAEHCDAAEGCVPGQPPLDCAELDSFCGYGFCDEAVHACMLEPINEGASCDDGDPLCTVEDACADGTCVGTPVCDPECQRCDAGACTDLCGNPYGRETDEMDVMDCLYSLRAVVGLEECPPCICDVNGDGAVSVSDTLTMLHCAVGGAFEMVCPRPWE